MFLLDAAANDALNATKNTLAEQLSPQAIINALPPSVVDNLSFLIILGKIFTILLVVYIILLIISKIMKIRDSRNISVIASQVSEINTKLNILTEKHSKKVKVEKKK